MALTPHAGNTLRNGIERLFDAREWERARWVLEGELLATPDDHWLHMQIALSWYEDARHDQALAAIQRALTLAPECPAVRWYHGGILHALGRHVDAEKVYRSIVERGIGWASEGSCGVGIGLAKGLIADSWWRISDLHRTRGEEEPAREAFSNFLDLLGPGCFGLYTLDVVTRHEDSFVRRQLRMRSSLRRPALSPVLN